MNSPIQAFDWPLADAAEQLLRSWITRFLRRNSTAAQLSERLRQETGTDFFEWLDHLAVGPDCLDDLTRAGFQASVAATSPGETVYEHPRATLPRVILTPRGAPLRAALRPEFVADFMARQHVSNEPEGAPCSRYRRVLVSDENDARLEAVERRAYPGFLPADLAPGELAAILQVRELWRTRPRFGPEVGGFHAANRILDRALQLVGRDLACQFFFEAERDYWESRNRAARLQKQRQDALGLGWGNHDHHTFRSSRQHFVDLIAFFERLGLHKRERFYAGAEAGWGAQVMEQPVTGIVVFADVDLLPDETTVDFSLLRLAPAARLGTVGLWVGLHGESFLQAGMHHLEARFDFYQLRDQLQQQGIGMMKPFSDFDFLRQAFTEGERWPVPPDRLNALRSQGFITAEQYAQFKRDGALGSHLENLQRHGGFKGFNQKSVSVVIAATDPRTAALGAH